ncbi:hypothetical protein N9D67_01020 [Gammaproteobacteria bacterium]|nr:hypothetical protein [Gammaproteobacteria bacterium]
MKWIFMAGSYKYITRKPLECIESNKTSDQQKMMNWWDDLCMQWYSDYDKNLTAKKLYSVLPELEESFQTEEHLIFNLDLNTIKNKFILHIGCGGGAADCIMRKYGMEY